MKMVFKYVFKYLKSTHIHKKNRVVGEVEPPKLPIYVQVKGYFEYV